MRRCGALCGGIRASIVRRDTGESYDAFLTRLAEASGLTTPTRAELARFDRTRKKKGSNADWTHPHDPDAKIAKMKDGRTHLAHTVAEREKLIISAQVSTGLIDDVRVAVIPARRHGAIVGVALLLADLGLAPAIAPAFKEQDLDVVGQPVDQCDGARGVGEDGVPALERQVGGDEQGAVLVGEVA